VKQNRDEAWALLTEFTQSDNLLRHALAVEAAMRWYAARCGADVDEWGIIGLLHDFDYERWPEAPDHPTEGMRILAERGWPREFIDTVGSHAGYMNIPRESPAAKTLFAVDELSGLLMAVAYVRPSRQIGDVGVSSVRKKMKDKAFARAVSREDIETGAAEIGLPLEEHIANCLAALAGVAPALGL
jgi:putative nucleotidyltransferase with HDIG domain